MAPPISNLRPPVRYLVAIALSVVLADIGKGAPYVAQAVVLEQESLGENAFTVYMPRQVPSPQNLWITPPPGAPEPTFEYPFNRGSFWDFATREEAFEFLAGNWGLQLMSSPFLEEPDGDKYRLTIDPLTIPDTAQFVGVLTSPSSGARIHQGEQINIEATLPSEPGAGTPTIFTSIQLNDEKRDFTFVAPRSGVYGGGGTSGAEIVGRKFEHEHRVLAPTDVWNVEQTFTTLGYALPAEIRISLGSQTLLQTADPVWMEGDSPGQLDFSLEVVYRYQPSPSAIIYLVPEPTSASLALLLILGPAAIWLRQRATRVSCS